MSEYTDFIGKTVLSSKFGSGEIVGVEVIGATQKFLVIECSEKRIRNFLPLEDSDSFRFLSNKDDFEQSLELLGTDELDGKGDDFESKKDRINYFKENSQKQDLKSIIELLVQLNILDSKSSAEEQIFNKLMDSLCLEYSLLYEMGLDESKKMMHSVLNS